MTFTDQFCGAGGSSQGVRNAAKSIKGLEVKLALNHWQLAIDTHQHNFPDTVHDCTDIQACDPRYYPKTDILITSPECTNHTLAKGQKYVKQMLQLFEDGTIDASAERSRATMWDVCRFAEFHNPLSTITTKPYHGLISSDSWNAFIDSYYGNITQNHILDPVGTIRTKESMNLITYDTPRLEDCYYRMLKPHEVQAAMAFDKDYHILGNSRDKVKQCGNAVTPPVMQWLVERVVKSLDI